MSDPVDISGQAFLYRLGRWILLFLVASLGFLQVGVRFIEYEFIATDLLAILLAAFWLAGTITRRIDLRWDRSYFFIALYFASAVISAIFSSETSRSVKVLPRELYLATLAFLTFVFVGQNQTMLKQTVVAWLFGSAFSILLGLATIALFYADPTAEVLQALTYHFGSVPVGNYPRITATFPSASMFCNYLNVGIVLGLLAAQQRWLRAPVVYALVAAGVICAGFTISIGLGVVFMSLCLAPLVIYGDRGVSSKVSGAVGIAAALAFLVLSTPSLRPRPATDSSTLLRPSSRVLVWQDALQTFIEHPLTGNGLGLPVANTIVENTDGSKSLLTDAHNSFLNVAAQSGIVGLAALIALTVYLLWIGANAFRSRERTFTRSLGLAFFASFVLQGLTGSFEEARHLWVLIGLLIAADQIESTASD